jgi:hypothetical protein
MPSPAWWTVSSPKVSLPKTRKGNSFPTPATLYLAPANPRYKPIVPKEELKVVAVVTAVVRKYARRH